MLIQYFYASVAKLRDCILEVGCFAPLELTRRNVNDYVNVLRRGTVVY